MRPPRTLLDQPTALIASVATIDSLVHVDTGRDTACYIRHYDANAQPHTGDSNVDYLAGGILVITVHIAICASISSCKLSIRALQQGYRDVLLRVASAWEMGERRATG